MKKADTVVFVEVKYLESLRQGDRLDYTTPKELDQMTFAAELWVSSHTWHGEYRLAVSAVSGDRYAVISFLEI